MATEGGQEQGGQGGQEGGNSWNSGQNSSGVGVIINFLNAGSMRLGDINAMGGGSGQNQGTIDTENITTIDDPKYDTAKTRVYYTDGTYNDFDWEGTVIEDTVNDSGLFEVDPNTYEYTWTKDIREVHFGTAVTAINNYAFSRNPTLSSITFERFASVAISGGAFSECPNLADASGFCVIKGRLVCVDPTKVGRNVTVPVSAYQITRVEAYSMVNSTQNKLVAVTIPGHVGIMLNAFADCKYITDLYLPDMELEDITYDNGDMGGAYTGWALGQDYNYETGENVYREITIHCSDGTYVQNEYGSWDIIPNE